MELAKILEFSGTAISMSSADDGINVPVDSRIKIEEIIGNDTEPKFVNVEVLRTGISKTNKRKYSEPVVRQVNGMVTGVQGYLGHPDPTKTSFEFREPHCIFVGSMVQEMGGGIVRSIGKAYLYPSSPLREWIPRSIAGGKPLTVSINGIGDIVRDIASGVIDVKSITELQSIDWANPGTEGMQTSTALSIVSELQNEGGAKMERDQIVRSVTIAEMKAYNSEVVTAIVSGTTIAELQAINPTIVDKIKESAKITEMQLTVDGKEVTVKLDKIQEMMDAKDAKIAELTSEAEKAKITEMKDKLLEAVPEQYRESVAKRITGTDEASIKASIDTEVAFIKEIAGNDNLPKGNGAKKVGTDMETAVKSMFGVKKEETK